MRRRIHILGDTHQDEMRRRIHGASSWLARCLLNASSFFNHPIHPPTDSTHCNRHSDFRLLTLQVAVFYILFFGLFGVKVGTAGINVEI